jgi:hypothetical protein
MQKLYAPADQWTAERLKGSDHCWRQVIESDLGVIVKFLNYVWMQDKEEE